MDRERVCFLLPVGLVFTAVDLTLRYSFVVCFVKGMNESIKNDSLETSSYCAFFTGSISWCSMMRFDRNNG